MKDDEKLRWLLAAASSGQVRRERYLAGPFYEEAPWELKPLLTDQWLFENDKEGELHDRDENPVGKPPAAKMRPATKQPSQKKHGKKT
ncbi:MAG: hypothetical protein IPJ41_11580 [Phycisphaerales bacterium]|nr:hypothetical protein [Phycisphaerales bacterium]